ncbi:hypothetical protein [Mesorhizobium dulcispinae]|uniref:hypothetical protein n=1 Tax=Mesorhizobium dulcispinae TaxID=3072316 RepID=UPI002A247FC5|nr:hypothetical protein [Mesorhizobium sp. VK23D]MDX8518729.1 hypothetical protein [Mesorhizobium sp. VK23D]
MTRKSFSAPNYDDPIDWLTPPTYLHAKPQSHPHLLQIAKGARIIVFTVEAGPDDQSIVVTVRSEGA